MLQSAPSDRYVAPEGVRFNRRTSKVTDPGLSTGVRKRSIARRVTGKNSSNLLEKDQSATSLDKKIRN
jgi:hypothetical protein